MNRDVIRQIVVILSILLLLVVNGLANTLPLNGQTTAEISDRFDIYFVPAGYVFSIWGLIYIGLVAYGVYQALPAQRENPRLRRTGYLFALSSLANAAWLFLWHYEVFALTVVVMVALLVLLIAIYLRLEVGRARVSAGERWAVHLPFSVYLGWISVATIANVSQYLDFIGWGAWGISPQVWAVIMLAVATALGAAMTISRRDVGYLLVLAWAFAGIAVEQAAAPLVANAAWVAAALAVVMAIAALAFRWRRVSSETGV